MPNPIADMPNGGMSAPPREDRSLAPNRDAQGPIYWLFGAARLDTRMPPGGAVIPALVPGGRGGLTLTTDGSVRENRRGEHRFFSAMAAAIVLVALAGFARTYFLRPLLPAPAPPPRELTPLIHLHGLSVHRLGAAALGPGEARGHEADRPPPPTRCGGRRDGGADGGSWHTDGDLRRRARRGALRDGPAPFPDRAALCHCPVRGLRRRRCPGATRRAEPQALDAARDDRAAASGHRALGAPPRPRPAGRVRRRHSSPAAAHRLGLEDAPAPPPGDALGRATPGRFGPLATDAGKN